MFEKKNFPYWVTTERWEITDQNTHLALAKHVLMLASFSQRLIWLTN